MVVRSKLESLETTNPLPVTEVRSPALPMSFLILVLHKAISLNTLVLSTKLFFESLAVRLCFFLCEIPRRRRYFLNLGWRGGSRGGRGRLWDVDGEAGIAVIRGLLVVGGAPKKLVLDFSDGARRHGGDPCGLDCKGRDGGEDGGRRREDGSTSSRRVVTRRPMTSYVSAATTQNGRHSSPRKILTIVYCGK